MDGQNTTGSWSEKAMAQTVAIHYILYSISETSHSLGHVLTPGRQLLGIDYLGSVFLACRNLHAPSHHREGPPRGRSDISSGGQHFLSFRVTMKEKGEVIFLTQLDASCSVFPHH